MSIKPKPGIKCLGVWFDKNITFVAHVKFIEEKTTRTVNALRRLYPRIKGPSESKRLLFATATILMYAVSVWKRSFKYNCYLKWPHL